jgi:Ca2+-binding EF-hand superfamily protein
MSQLPRINACTQHVQGKKSVGGVREFSRQALKLSEERRALCCSGAAGSDVDGFLKRKCTELPDRAASLPAASKPKSVLPDVVPPPSRASPSRARSAFSASRSFAAQAPKLGMESPVKCMLHQMLPAIESPKKTPKRMRLLTHARAVCAVTALSAAVAEPPPTPGGCSSASLLQPQGSKKLLEDFRARLLQRFRSVHDAFNEFDCIAKDKALSFQEFQQAVLRLGISGGKEAKVLFKAMDTDKSGEVSMTEFLLALVDVSPQALLWELRCRLDSEGIRLNTLHKIFDLIKRQDRKHPPAIGDRDIENKEKRLRERELWKSMQLSRTDWIKLGAALGLTINESERLFLLIDTDESRTIDLEEMFAALRAVAPDVSLERFVMKVLVYYGTLPEAFRVHASRSPDARSPLLGLQEFLSLAAVLGVNDGNAQRLWEALDIASRIDADDAMDEELFIKQMQAWAPATALDRLREEICEHFGNIAEGRRTLQKHGVPRAGALSAASFEAGLRAAGVTHCDAQLVLSTVCCSRPGSPNHAPGVTLDEVMKSLSGDSTRTSPGRLKSKARVIIGNDMDPYWQQILAMKNDLRRGLSDVPRTPCPEKGDKFFHVIQDRLSQLKEGQGQNVAYKGIMELKQKLQKRGGRLSSHPFQQNANLSNDRHSQSESQHDVLEAGVERACADSGTAFFLTE